MVKTNLAHFKKKLYYKEENITDNSHQILLLRVLGEQILQCRHLNYHKVSIAYDSLK